MVKEYEVIVIGGGIIGASTLYVLSKYTDVKKIALLEKNNKIGMGVSNKDSNSQTLHFGDIETNYSLEKAKKVKEAADMVVRYIESQKDTKLYSKSHKMVLAVGKNEVKKLEKRYEKFKGLFPKLEKIGRKELKKIEPKVIEARDLSVELLALKSEDGYRMDYGRMTESFIKNAKKQKKSIDIITNTKVMSIEKDGKKFIVRTQNSEYYADAILVAAGAMSLKFAHKLDYGKKYILLPVVGNFFCAKNMTRGKVYMMQLESIPFAAVHADPDVHDPSETRYGPLAKVLPILEKNNYKSFFDFMHLFEFRWDAIMSIFNILSKPIYIKYVMKQFLYDLPVIGKAAFLKEARKITPSIKYSDLTFGKSLGGIRPQIVDTEKRALSFGEAKITGKNIIFDVTPSPGASVCLKNAERNARRIVKFLDKKFYDKKFEKNMK